jgi:hypothetical protein
MYKFRRINSNNTKLLFQNNLGKCYSMMEDKYLANEWYSMVDYIREGSNTENGLSILLRIFYSR